MSSAEPRLWVVDASVAFGWFAQVAGSASAAALLESSPPARLIAPDLVLVELLNAGWKARRIGAITDEQFEAISQLAPSLFSELVHAGQLLGAAHQWCQRLDHPAHDCLYLALAELRGGVLVTQDRRLLTKLHGVESAERLAVPLEQWQQA